MLRRLSQIQFSPLVLFSIALGLRLLWWSISLAIGKYDFVTIDSEQYLRAAQNMLNGHGFSLANEAPYLPDMFRTPGYPVFLLPFVAMKWAPSVIALIQTMMGAALPVLVFRTAQRLGWASAALGAWLVVVDASSVIFFPLVLSDGLFALIFALLIYSLSRGRFHLKDLCWQAFLLGAMILVRPIATYLPFLLLIWWGGHSAKWRHILVAMLILFALPGGWVLRNYYALQTPAISTVGQTGLFLYWAAGTHALAHEKDFEEVQRAFLKEAYHAFDWDNEPAVNAKYMRYARKRTLEEVGQHPVAAFRVAAMNGVYFFLKPPRGYFDLALGSSSGYAPVGAQADRRGWGERIRAASAKTSTTAWWLTGWQLTLNVLQLILAAWGMRVLWNKNRRWFWLLLLGVTYFCFFSLFTQTDARFRLPALPLMALAATAISVRRKPSAINA